MFVSQLKRLEGWFVRLPIDAETARILAYLDLDEGLNRITRRLRRRPDRHELYAYRRMFSPERFLQDRYGFPLSYIRVGAKYLKLRDSRPGEDADWLWDEAALASKRTIPLSDGSANHGWHEYGFNGRERFEALCARLDGPLPADRGEPFDRLECDPPTPPRPHSNGPDYRPAYLWAVRWLRALHAPENTLHRLALDVLDRMRGRAGSVDPLAPLSRALGGVDATARVALAAARLALDDGQTRIGPEQWNRAARTTGLAFTHGVPDGVQGLFLWVDRIRYASRGWLSDRPPYGRHDLHDEDDFDDILALADLDRELGRLDASLATSRRRTA